MEPLLIAGLGNPGAEYAGTRHNVGFLAVEALAQKHGAAWKEDRKFVARLARCEVQGRRLILCEPQTFMNASGEAVGAVARFQRVPPERALVVVDDADLPFGEIRLRERGSPGGHHGLESVEQHLGSREYPRLRIGIGRQAAAGRDIAGHVLGAFAADERRVLPELLAAVVLQIECWAAEGAGKAMNEFNGAVIGPDKRTKDKL
jgi:peptidyl-tRNA hydrolase, PTH1 family